MAASIESRGRQGSPRGDVRNQTAPGEVREAPKELPRTTRGLRTRAALVQAARVVFERDGYLYARLTDITAEAGMATGTFYTYFHGKADIFAAVLEDLNEEMLHPRIGADVGHGIIAGIEASNRSYLTSYRHNAKLMQLVEQVASIDEEFRLARNKRAASFVDRNARRIRELQETGMADAELDPELSAQALSGMVSRLAFRNYAMGQSEADIEDLISLSTRLWVNALRIPRESGGAA